MRPSLIHELLVADATLQGLGIDADRIMESQSIDTRPFDSGVFLTVSFEETSYTLPINRGPVIMTLAGHIPMDDGRDFTDIHIALNAAQVVLTAIENGVGNDGVRVGQASPLGRGANQTDEGWMTLTKTATYRVLYDESLG